MGTFKGPLWTIWLLENHLNVHQIEVAMVEVHEKYLKFILHHF